MFVWTPSQDPYSVHLSLILTTLQTLYHRRVRDKSCVVGSQPKAAEKVVKNCPCIDSDFEWYVHTVRGLCSGANACGAANSITLRMQLGSVFSSLVQHLYPATILVEMARTTGMSEPPTAKYRIRAAKMGSDQIVVFGISVQALEPMDPFSGGS